MCVCVVAWASDGCQPFAGPGGIQSVFHLQCPLNELDQTSTQRRWERKAQWRKEVTVNNTMALEDFLTGPQTQQT